MSQASSMHTILPFFYCEFLVKTREETRSISVSFPSSWCIQQTGKVGGGSYNKTAHLKKKKKENLTALGHVTLQGKPDQTTRSCRPSNHSLGTSKWDRNTTMSRDVEGAMASNLIVSPPQYKTPSTLQTTHTQKTLTLCTLQ